MKIHPLTVCREKLQNNDFITTNYRKKAEMLEDIIAEEEELRNFAAEIYFEISNKILVRNSKRRKVLDCLKKLNLEYNYTSYVTDFDEINTMLEQFENRCQQLLGKKNDFSDAIENDYLNSRNILRNSIMDDTDIYNSRDIYYSRISFDGKEEDSSKLPWHESGTCFYEDYIPEYERYGDGKLMEISENIFYHSSRLALSIFKNVKGINKRIVLSSYIIYKLLCYNNGLTLDFLNSYQTYWKKMVINEPKIKKEVICSVFDSIEKGRIDLSFMDNELEEMCNGFGKMRELTTDMERLYITSSQIHMMNNRISVTPDFEYIITREMGEWLGEKMENSKG